MATARFIQEGKSIDYTPSAAVTAGDVVVLGDLIGVAAHSIAADTLGALQIAGVFSFPKATGEGTDIAAGAKLYWNATDSRVEKTDGTGSYKYLGKAVAAATTTDTTVTALLVP